MSSRTKKKVCHITIPEVWHAKVKQAMTVANDELKEKGELTKYTMPTFTVYLLMKGLDEVAQEVTA